MVDRLSTSLMFSLLGKQIAANQQEIFKLSKTINSQKKFSTSYDDPVALIGAIGIQGRILQNDQSTRDRGQAQRELDAGEVALTGMNNILDRIKEIGVTSSSDTLAGTERTAFAEELKTLVESLTQFANSKVGNTYIFSGQQSDLQTIRLQSSSPYDSAVYKHNQDDTKQRFIDGVQSSVDLRDTLVSQGSSARLESTVINPVASVSGNLNFSINDGNDVLTEFSVNISSGDDLSTIVTKINAAFTSAGGLGSIAAENPSGYLSMDTSLVTGSSVGEKAKIQVLKSSTSALANQLHIKKQINLGKEMGLYHTLEALDTALRTNDSAGIRNLLDNIEFNKDQINEAISKVGLSVAQIERLNNASDDLDIKLRSDLSTAQDIDVIKANLDFANAQAALETSIQTSSNFFRQTLSRFLS